ncbi:MAG TPA: UDP-glucose--hexose-1-phosphate uridylyltransferase [Candidatus Latescibacteria bacterium]|jgi:UDPglucose--hexose-1-phosphate uridylyltransferase|nr:galactose-1-phosphate uridylyltransferase [Gemmatimonadaceae bacterium]MDP6018187.1 UDP-glucose--hexose-1-phosphate uridylyltransferase [Candidatus Latescibacterota bacterium]HJP29549.1 UDP-glucose--hexose-1-phosphate uridylyltransferase [Candidatus Latescibacterota bacterium]
MIDTDHPHRRHNPLTGEWVQVSPHRMQRPWQGRVDAAPGESRPAHDPTCYLCPGNERAGGHHNPEYTSTFVFDNDFAALLPQAPESRHQTAEPSLLRTAPVQGECRVLCFSPRHDLTLAQLEPSATRAVIDMWAAQVEELGSLYRWVQVFENKGEVMGCSNPHPHGQVWALDTLPNEPAKEDETQAAYFADHGRPLLLDYAKLETEREERVVAATDGWVAVVPFWAVWPFEVLLLPKRHVPHLTDLGDDERDDLTRILGRLLRRYDALFDTSFPYSMGWHGRPSIEGGDGWQLHAHFYPPLLRSATVRKFMVGYEMLGEAQRDLTAEAAAAHLRSGIAQHEE